MIQIIWTIANGATPVLQHHNDELFRENSLVPLNLSIEHQNYLKIMADHGHQYTDSVH